MPVLYDNVCSYVKDKAVLITGAMGFVGSQPVELLNKGYKVRCLTRKPVI